MGAIGPKRIVEFDEMALLAEAVNDAIITGHTNDEVLDLLLDITVVSITEGRPLFPNPLEEPVFYRRYFKEWVLEGLEDIQELKKLSKQYERA